MNFEHQTLKVGSSMFDVRYSKLLVVEIKLMFKSREEELDIVEF